MRGFVAAIPVTWRFVLIGILLTVLGAGSLDAGLKNTGEALITLGVFSLFAAFISWADRESNGRG